MSSPANDLIGHWRSNRELTLAEMDKSACIKPEQRAILEPMIGQLVLTYTEDVLTNYLDGTHFAGSYRVVRQTATSVVIELHDEVTDIPVQREIFVQDDRMWVAVPNLGFNEIFTRVDPSQVPSDTKPLELR